MPVDGAVANAACLPTPDIPEDVCEHSYKQVSRRLDTSRLRPPKLKRAMDLSINRSYSIMPMAITSPKAIGLSFHKDAREDLLGALYDRSSELSYFDQCFVKIAKIGEGSFGEVFKVRSKEDNRLYAVKMSKQLFRSEQYRQERLEEVRRYEQFSGHSNCVRFYRAWEQDDRLYMQMELCRENLESYLEKHRHVPEPKIWSILLDLLLALKSLHDRNLIHMDIKLDNVLIGNDDSSKLADFGLVISVNKANLQDATEGDCRYMAPEIMQGRFSKAADIFSLGIAMLELSCYIELPCNGHLWQELRNGILPENFLVGLSMELRTIIRQMMAPQPEMRPNVDQLLCHKQLHNLLRQRNRWRYLKKFTKILGRTRRVLWSKVCNLKSALISFFARWMSKLRFNKRLPLKSPLKITYNAPMDSRRLTAPNEFMDFFSSTPLNKKNGAYKHAQRIVYEQENGEEQKRLLMAAQTHLNISKSRKDLISTFMELDSSMDQQETDLNERWYFPFDDSLDT